MPDSVTSHTHSVRRSTVAKYSAPAEHHNQVVRRHRDPLRPHEFMLMGERGDFVEIAYAPGRVARPQIRIERRVAGGGMHATFAERAIEEEQPTMGQDTRGASDQSSGGGPGRDMDHIDRDDRVCLGYRPGVRG